MSRCATHDIEQQVDVVMVGHDRGGGGHGRDRDGGIVVIAVGTEMMVSSSQGWWRCRDRGGGVGMVRHGV